MNDKNNAFLSTERGRLAMHALKVFIGFLCVSALAFAEADFERVLYKQPDLVVDLGVGLWAQPLPMDADGDGDLDMVVATADVPYNGINIFENPGGDAKYPVFKKARRLGKAEHDICVSYVEGQPVVMTPGRVHTDFLSTGIDKAKRMDFDFEYQPKRPRAKQWKLVDYNGDTLQDLVLGIGVWDDYGWDNAFNAQGEWTNGPLHGYVFVALNTASNKSPNYAPAFQVMCGEKPLDVYGAPSPNFSDWDGDSDLDLICGEFLDRITYFENMGSREKPEYKAGQFLKHDGEVIKMELEMLQVVAVDWDKDGDTDLVVGQEDGRVALMECTGQINEGQPEFLPPRFFQQEADAVKIGALCTPFSVDWDSDGDEDLIAGDTAGFINFVENLEGVAPPSFASPQPMRADGKIVRIQAGENGSIQGPCEAKWGYTVLTVADWNGDSHLDIVCNSIWGKVVCYEGTGAKLDVKAAQPIEVAWEGETPKPAWFWWTPDGKELVTQWRTTPVAFDLNKDLLMDLVMLDTEGYLSFFERVRTGDTLELLPGKRIFQDEAGNPLRLNDGIAGKSGRRQFRLVDWDADGKLDILLDSKNVDFLKNISEVPGVYRFKNMGQVAERRLAGHTTCPTVVNWDKNGAPDLLVGAEDGFLYYLKRE